MASKHHRGLTAYYQFMAIKRFNAAPPLRLDPSRRHDFCALYSDKLRESGDLRIGTSEVLRHWKALSEQERKEWEDKAAKEQKRYLQVL